MEMELVTTFSLFFLMKFYAIRRLRMQRRRRQLDRARKRVDILRRRLKKQRTQLLALAFTLCMSPPIERRFWESPSRYLCGFYYHIFGTAQIIAMNCICVTTVAASYILRLMHTFVYNMIMHCRLCFCIYDSYIILECEV